MSAKEKFQFGGHMTFPVRYGWVPKGLSRLRGGGAFVANAETADALGLGSKMVESLSFWLRSFGLLSDADRERTASPLADLVLKADPYCELPGTWWFLHLGLARQHGTVWSWFFNFQNDRSFDRTAAVDAFLAHARERSSRPPTAAVAQRDIACLISAFAARPGVDFVDPDDLGACPLRELGLLLRHDHVHRFERTRTPRGVPGEALLASASLLAAESGRDAISLRELATAPYGPGRIFCADWETLDRALASAASGSPHASVETHAGEQLLVLARRPKSSWMEDFYRRLGLPA